MKNKIIVCALLMGVSFLANSTSQTKKVLRVGCHVNSNVCFAYIEGSITSNCPSNDGSFRWDGKSDPNGKSALSILLSAHATGKTVTFGGSSCYSNFPSFSYLMINKS